MSEKLVIRGGKPLNGEVFVSGAKNAAVAIIPATILADTPSTIDNLPYIDDVKILDEILTKMGAEVELSALGTMTINAADLNEYHATYDAARRMRASYYFLGALLGRFGKAEIISPGGCAIGLRPIDLHLKGMERLGAKVEMRDGHVFASAPNGLTGADIYLDIASVGATINIMMAAVTATGRTTIVNAAKEPHIVDVANFLNKMGARVSGAGTDVIKIRGVEKLHGTSYSVIPDQIETGTLMIAAAATRGDVYIKNAIPEHMDALTAKLIEAGVSVEDNEEYIHVFGGRRPQAIKLKTLPYPGFPTDLQQPISVMLATAQGASVIVETMFESRFKHANEIRRMGADVSVNGQVCVINGVDHLVGAPIRATDLRAGAALVIAGLMAEGKTEIHNTKYIDRGYDRLEQKLVALGADISRQTVEGGYFDFDY